MKTIDELTAYITTMEAKLNEDLRNLADEMEALDPNSKDFEYLDIEYNFINGQTVMLNHLLHKIGK